MANKRLLYFIFGILFIVLDCICIVFVMYCIVLEYYLEEKWWMLFLDLLLCLLSTKMPKHL